MKKLSLLSALTAACLLAYAVPSGAVVVPTLMPDLGNLTASGSADIGNTYAITGTSFLDIYTFSIGPSTSFLDAYSFTVTNTRKTSGISDYSMNLYNSAHALIATGFTPTLGSLTTSELSTTLSAGNYQLEVGGTVSGSVSGSYAGLLQAAPVPEPETYAMLLAGLGMLGLIARRRSQT